MKIYLDVDGVLLDSNYEQMPYVREFLNTVFDISNGEVYWLTTHRRDGISTEVVLGHLVEVVDSDIYDMVKRIKPTKWDTLKTEGIDLNEEFLWFDDNVFNAE